MTLFCAELATLRREAARLPESRRQLLARIEAEARARRPILRLLHELLGADPADTMRSVSTGLPGTGPGQADEERFGCPDLACDRLSGTSPAGPPPCCPITGEAMIRR